MITPRTPKSEINMSDLNRDAVRQAHRDSDFLADIVGGFIQKLTNEEQQVLREQLDYYMDAGYVDDEGYCLLYTSPSPRDRQKSRMPSSA